ncbi:MAG: long-chain fatty acid--CoA ligase, partial [Pirellulales bacterium]
VGPPIRDVEVRIADDGEILTRGPHVMLGYYKNPEATAAAIQDGWFHTGDLGEQDEDGFLRITGRKKEIIVLATGKNIAPAQIEGLLTQDPLILQALVCGSEQKFLSALIVPNPDALRDEIRQRRIVVLPRQHALTNKHVLQLFQQRIEDRLSGLSNSEQVRRFRLLDRGFTIEGGELTPTLKLRRDTIMAIFSDLIQSMYDDVEK